MALKICFEPKVTDAAICAGVCYGKSTIILNHCQTLFAIRNRNRISCYKSPIFCGSSKTIGTIGVPSFWVACSVNALIWGGIMVSC